MGIVRMLVRGLVKPCDERMIEDEPKKFIPADIVPLSIRRGKMVEYVKEIVGTTTGKPIAYEKESGEWVIDIKAHDEEFRAQQALSYPRFCP